MAYLDGAGRVASELASSTAWAQSGMSHMDAVISFTAVTAQIHSLTPDLSKAGTARSLNVTERANVSIRPNTSEDSESLV